MKYIVVFVAVLGIVSAKDGFLASYVETAVNNINEMANITAVGFKEGAGALNGPNGILDTFLGKNGILCRLLIQFCRSIKPSECYLALK